MTGCALCGVSLGTMTVITVDRLLVLLLGLRYKQTVTLKRTNIILASVWVLSGVAALCYILDYRITLWYGYNCDPSYLVASIFSHTKILVVCYIPFIVVEIVIVEADRKTFSSHLLVTRGMVATLLYSNSRLNLFLYCWKINEVRQALCCPWN